MIKKLKRFFNNLRISFFFGLKKTDEDIFGQKTNSLGETISEQKQQLNQLGEALLKGEVTQEVEMLRDRTYWVADKSKEYKVIIDTLGTTKAINVGSKKNKLININIPSVLRFENDSLEIVMDNLPIPTSILKGFQAVGSHGIKNEYPLKFEYEYSPKFKLDEYVRKIVVRKSIVDENTFVDLYVPKFVDSYERLERIFDVELKKIKENKTKPINIEFDTVYFLSDKAYGVDDLCEYKFKFKEFIGINEFDGKHVLTYIVDTLEYGNKITDKFKNDKLRKKYENNEARTTTLDLTGEFKNSCKCDACDNIVNLYDYRITKNSIGSGLCKDCLEKRIN